MISGDNDIRPILLFSSHSNLWRMATSHRAGPGGPVWKGLISVILAGWFLFAAWTINPILIVAWVLVVAGVVLGKEESLPRRVWDGNFS